MKKYEIERYLDLLFSRALSKCGNLDESEELMQETALCALVYLAKGKKVDLVSTSDWYLVWKHSSQFII